MIREFVFAKSHMLDMQDCISLGFEPGILSLAVKLFYKLLWNSNVYKTEIK